MERGIAAVTAVPFFVFARSSRSTLMAYHPPLLRTANFLLNRKLCAVPRIFA